MSRKIWLRNGKSFFFIFPVPSIPRGIVILECFVRHSTTSYHDGIFIRQISVSLTLTIVWR